MSLLSKSVSKKMARGTFNSGLLATEAGTLGRAIGDLTVYFTLSHNNNNNSNNNNNNNNNDDDYFYYNYDDNDNSGNGNTNTNGNNGNSGGGGGVNIDSDKLELCILPWLCGFFLMFIISVISYRKLLPHYVQ